jgi:hypothetical protein
MAKIAFWITAGPELEDKALSGLRLASRLKAVRQQDVQVFFYGPGVRLAVSNTPRMVEALSELREAQVSFGACPVNAERMGVDPELVSATGSDLRSAVDVMVDLVEQGYQVIGI